MSVYNKFTKESQDAGITIETSQYRIKIPNFIKGVADNYYNERTDRRFYEVGFGLAQDTKIGKLQESDLVNYLKSGIAESQRICEMPAFGEYGESISNYFR